ncbi:hypothetical protein MLD38_026878 [Melastoma candidum]|uniref:Uncharacterized protein n=1 Tax=Melastoma candidum TaxID=119954 RepID=A0ACB9P1I4_9MYRT|nr:hypothetical protein MLD38_026878 [Melastoma candidum]
MSVSSRILSVLRPSNSYPESPPHFPIHESNVPVPNPYHRVPDQQPILPVRLPQDDCPCRVLVAQVEDPRVPFQDLSHPSPIAEPQTICQQHYQVLLLCLLPHCQPQHLVQHRHHPLLRLVPTRCQVECVLVRGHVRKLLPSLQPLCHILPQHIPAREIHVISYSGLPRTNLSSSLL